MSSTLASIIKVLIKCTKSCFLWIFCLLLACVIVIRVLFFKVILDERCKLSYLVFFGLFSYFCLSTWNISLTVSLCTSFRYSGPHEIQTFLSHKKELTVIKEQMKAVICSSYAEMNCSNLVPSCQGIFSLKETRYLQWLFKNVIFWTHSYTKSMSILYSNRFPSFYFGTRWYTRHRSLCFPLRRFYNFMSW